MVITNEEVQDGVARASGHRFYNLIRYWWDARVADSDCVEGLKVVDEAEGSVLFLDAEPAGAVGGVGALVHARSDLLLE